MFIMFTIDSEYLAAMQPHAIVRVFRELFKFLLLLLSVLQLCEYSELFESLLNEFWQSIRMCEPAMRDKSRQHVFKV